MVSKSSKSYKLIFGLSGKLFVIGVLFRKRKFAEIAYEMHVVTNLEERVKIIFKDKALEECLKEVDGVLLEARRMAICTANGSQTDTNNISDKFESLANKVRELALKHRLAVSAGSVDGQLRLGPEDTLGAMTRTRL
jgi:hypothetical protein